MALALIFPYNFLGVETKRATKLYYMIKSQNCGMVPSYRNENFLRNERCVSQPSLDFEENCFGKSLLFQYK